MMLRLQDMGCYNINFVTPSHVAPQIAESVLWAARNGLRIPLVYNTGGYDGLETLALLDGIIDIYMPDIKFMNPETSRVLMSAEDYPTVVQAAVKEMHRQVGDLVIDSTGLAQRGLLVRHLVMPGNAADTRLVMRFLAREISPKTYVNIMDQYRPCGRAKKFDAIARAISTREYADALNAAEEEGMRRLDRRARRFTV
jgi:putative pyruvate formate lyase activating enzyme